MRTDKQQMYGIEQSATILASQEDPCRTDHVLKVELLESMSECLHDLEEVKLLGSDPDVVRLKQHLR